MFLFGDRRAVDALSGVADGRVDDNTLPPASSGRLAGRSSLAFLGLEWRGLRSRGGFCRTTLLGGGGVVDDTNSGVAFWGCAGGRRVKNVSLLGAMNVLVNVGRLWKSSGLEGLTAKEVVECRRLKIWAS